MELELAILVPVLGRPHRVRPLLDSIARATTVSHRVLFLVSPSDAVEVAAIKQENAELWAVKGNYAAKTRAGIEVTDEPLVFTAADDIVFEPGWFEAAKAYIDTGAQVVGVNDLIKRGREHATHFLMTREYAELPTIDGGPGPFADVYHHWRVDDELIATAKHRGVYAYAKDSHVRHEHPMTGAAPDDSTYQLGRSRARADNRVFSLRKRLWSVE